MTHPAHLWAKLSADGMSWHSLVDHSADVAAVLMALLEQPTIAARIAKLGGLSELPAGLRVRLSALAFLHDFGKANRGFQARRDPAAPRVGHIDQVAWLFGADGTTPLAGVYNMLGFDRMEGWFEDDAAMEWLAAVMAHHGRPWRLTDPPHSEPHWRAIGADDPIGQLAPLRNALDKWFARAFEPAPRLPSRPAMVHAFAGLLMLADWLGSDARFTFANGQDSNRWPSAQAIAAKILRDVGLDVAESRLRLRAVSVSFEAAFSVPSPRPIQTLAIQPSAPLVILESETGSGKTEAALWRFKHMFEAGAVDGLYFALPTRGRRARCTNASCAFVTASLARLADQRSCWPCQAKYGPTMPAATRCQISGSSGVTIRGVGRTGRAGRPSTPNGSWPRRSPSAPSTRRCSARSAFVMPTCVAARCCATCLWSTKSMLRTATWATCWLSCFAGIPLGCRGHRRVMRCLLLTLEAPMMSFGREMVDARGPITDFPAASMLTGLLANALGWRCEQREAHAALQHRLRFAVRLDRVGQRFTDFQTAQLAKNDAGWTTHGRREGRRGDSYASPHIRLRDFAADAYVAVAMTLDLVAEPPTVDALAAALTHPARPLFIGRKPCLPSRPLLHEVADHDDLLAALSAIPAADDAAASPLVLLPGEAPALPGDELRSITEPVASRLESTIPMAPPPTRGWTCFRWGQRARERGSPAHAGIDPAAIAEAACPCRLPRQREDSPGVIRFGFRTDMAPRPRGSGPSAS